MTRRRLREKKAARRQTEVPGLVPSHHTKVVRMNPFKAPPRSPMVPVDWPSQAAKFSWMAPIAAVALGIMGTFLRAGSTQDDPAMERTTTMILGWISIAIVVAGLVLGIAALTQIGKHGTRRILVPAVVGILLCSAYIALVVWTIYFMLDLKQKQQAMAGPPVHVFVSTDAG